MKTRKTWREKMQTAREAKIVTIPSKMQKRMGPGTMLIPGSAIDVDALIRKVPRGKLVTQTQLREKLARDAGADTACPVLTGIFVRIVAEAAEESSREGKLRITPYWRIVRDDGRLLEKLPGGPSAQAGKLAGEGHRIDRSGKLRVEDISAALTRIT